MGQNLFVKCKECQAIIERKKFIENHYVCPLCGYFGTLDYKKTFIKSYTKLVDLLSYFIVSKLRRLTFVSFLKHTIKYLIIGKTMSFLNHSDTVIRV